MIIDIITVQQRMFAGFLEESIVARAVKKGACEINIIDLRDYAKGSYRKVDDKVYGGGPGMLMMCEPWFAAVEDRIAKVPCSDGARKVIMTSPGGKKFNQSAARNFSEAEHLIFMCGHYEGFDERIKTLATDELSIGDFVMTGGELASAVMVDAIVRLLPGVLGGGTAAIESESFGRSSLLEPPQYTKPAEFRGMKVPEVLLSGDHMKIEAWRKSESLRLTALLRPDLLDNGEKA
jgi:tRNA (guanine37-N1)-methyltransferase